MLAYATSVTIFEFLAASTWTWVVGTRHFVTNNRLMPLFLLALCSLISRCTLCFIGTFEVVFLLMVALLMHFRRSLYDILLLLYRQLGTH